MCHHNTFLIYSSIADASQKKWETVTHASILTSLVVACLFGIAGYATFKAYSQGNILYIMYIHTVYNFVQFLIRWFAGKLLLGRRSNERQPASVQRSDPAHLSDRVFRHKGGHREFHYRQRSQRANVREDTLCDHANHHSYYVFDIDGDRLSWGRFGVECKLMSFKLYLFKLQLLRHWTRHATFIRVELNCCT